MTEAFRFDRKRGTKSPDVPIYSKSGVEMTKAGERAYLEVELDEDYSVWSTLSSDRRSAWIEQINTPDDIDAPRIAEFLLRGFAISAARAGIAELRIASATARELHTLAHVFGEQYIDFYDETSNENPLPMTLNQVLESIDRIDAQAKVDPGSLGGYFDIKVNLHEIDTTAWGYSEKAPDD